MCSVVLWANTGMAKKSVASVAELFDDDLCHAAVGALFKTDPRGLADAVAADMRKAAFHDRQVRKGEGDWSRSKAGASVKPEAARAIIAVALDIQGRQRRPWIASMQLVSGV